MLKKLANNFYSSAISYNSYNNVRKEQLNKDEIELINNKIALLKESITEAIASKNFFYKEIKISKNYNQDKYVKECMQTFKSLVSITTLTLLNDSPIKP